MSSRKNLKKQINDSITLLFTDVVVYKTYIANADTAAADKIIDKLVEIQDEFLSRMNATEGKETKGRIKNYFIKLKADFQKAINLIDKDIKQLP